MVAQIRSAGERRAEREALGAGHARGGQSGVIGAGNRSRWGPFHDPAKLTTLGRKDLGLSIAEDLV